MNGLQRKNELDKGMTGLLILSVFAFSTQLFSQDLGHLLETRHGFSNITRTVTESPDNTFYNNIKAQQNTPPVRDDGSGELLWTYVDQNGISERIALSADGRWLATGYSLNDERLELRNAEDGELQFRFDVESGSGWVSISGDGMITAFAALDSVWLFRRDGEGIPFFRFGMPGYYPGPVKLTRDGRRLVVSGVDIDRETNLAWGFSVDSEEPLWTYEVDAEEAFGWYGINIAEEAEIAAINGKYHLYVVDLLNGEEIWTEPTYNTEGDIGISEDGTILAVGSLTGRLSVYGRDPDGDGYRQLWHYSFRGGLSTWVTKCAVSSDGNYLAAGTLDFHEDHFTGRYALFDTYGYGEPLWVADTLADEIAGIAFSRDSGILAVTTWGDLENAEPDLLIHEVFNPDPIFRLITPGSLTGVCVSDDGSVVAAGGKAVHNRIFGRGGRIVVIRTEISGGEVMGTVTDGDDAPVEDAVISAEDNPYTAVTDGDGNYRLRVETDDRRLVTVTARKRGFLGDHAEDIEVLSGEVSGDVDFVLESADEAPQGIRATQGIRNQVVIQWDGYNEASGIQAGAANPVIFTAVGERLPEISPVPWAYEKTRQPRRDHADEAEAINIYRSSLRGGPYRLIESVDGDQTMFVDRQRVYPQHQYYYVVTADFGNGESEYSAEVTGWVDEDFLVWEADLVSMDNPPQIDGEINDGEWEGAVSRDISDVFGYDAPDSAGSVEALIGFCDADDQLYLGFRYYSERELSNRMGVGVYVDDDNSDSWTWEKPGSEGNYWGYWVDEEPQMTYRSLTGAPYSREPYYLFENPSLAFGDAAGYVQIEMAIPLGFHGPEEVGLYPPDLNIGLGLFAMIRDEDELPIFNGWWPQDVLSIVSNPEQFAEVHVPADLVVPPVAPTDVFVDRDGEDLLIMWRDPVMGIDGAELEGLAGVEVQRNGEPVGTAEAGEQEWFDEDVSDLGWYQYELTGFVMEDGERFYGTTSEPVGIYAGQEPEITELSNDDGSAEAFYIVNTQGDDNRFAVMYSLDDFRDTVGVFWVDILPRNAAPIDVYIARDQDWLPGAVIGNRFRMEPRREEEFCRFHFPGIQQPRIIIDPDDFNSCWVVLEYLDSSPAAPAIGVDRSVTDLRRNKYHTGENGWQDFDRGRIMIRIGIGHPRSSTPDPEAPYIPEVFALGQNFPNPFNGSCSIPVELPVAADLQMNVFDLKGRLQITKTLGFFQVGRTLVTLNSNSLPAGLYIVSLNAGNETKRIKVIVAK